MLGYVREPTTMLFVCWHAGLARPAAATLMERAQRLAHAVDAVGSGVHATANLLSPRTKLLQAALSATGVCRRALRASWAAFERGLAQPRTKCHIVESRCGQLLAGTGTDGEALWPASPTRQMQPDGTIAIQYMPQVRLNLPAANSSLDHQPATSHDT